MSAEVVSAVAMALTANHSLQTLKWVPEHNASCILCGMYGALNQQYVWKLGSICKSSAVSIPHKIDCLSHDKSDLSGLHYAQWEWICFQAVASPFLSWDILSWPNSSISLFIIKCSILIWYFAECTISDEAAIAIAVAMKTILCRHWIEFQTQLSVVTCVLCPQCVVGV